MIHTQENSNMLIDQLFTKNNHKKSIKQKTGSLKRSIKLMDFYLDGLRKKEGKLPKSEPPYRRRRLTENIMNNFRQPHYRYLG